MFLKHAHYPFKEEAFFAIEIIRLIHQRGLPSTIKMRSESERGPLAVTLVGELAATLKTKLFTSQVFGRWENELHVYFMEVLGEVYIRKKEKSRLLRNEIPLLEKKLLSLERISVAEELARLVGEQTKKGTLSRSLSGLKIAWTLGPSSRLRRAEYDATWDRLQESFSELKDVENDLQQLTDETASLRDFPRGFRKHLLERHLVSDDYTTPTDVKDKGLAISLQTIDVDRSDGALFLLKTKDSVWFNLLASHIESAILRTVNAGGKRIAMRNQDLIARVSTMARLYTPNASWSTVLSKLEEYSPHLGWPKASDRSYSEESIRAAQKSIRDEDKELIEWTLKNGGDSHPFLFADAQQDEKYVRQLNDLFPAERAQNELHWVLSKGCPRAFPPAISTRYTQNDWEEWQKRAEKEKPPLWKNNVISPL